MVMTRKSPPKRALLGLATSQRLKLVHMIIKADSSMCKRFAASSQTSHIGNRCPRAANFLASGSNYFCPRPLDQKELSAPTSMPDVFIRRLDHRVPR